MVSGVRIRGPFIGPSGYDRHVREFVRTLSERGLSVQLENLNEWSPVRLPYHLREPRFEALSDSVDSRVCLHFSFPSQVSPDPSATNVNFTMFEATRIPDAWVKAHLLSELIVVPTKHSFRAWVDSDVPQSKVRLCPLGVRADLFRPGVPALALGSVAGQAVGSYRVRFLNVSEAGPRKNLTGLVTAWLSATTPDDDAVLILKIGCYAPGSLSLFEDEMRAAQQLAAKRFDEAAPVHLVHDLYPDADMPRLFATATHYISLSFGEGWDLSMMEAAATGLRLIAPAHSGYLEYLDNNVASMVPSQESPVFAAPTSWTNDLFAGLSWWQPDQETARRLIRRAIEGDDAPRGSPRARIASNFTWDKAADRLIEILREAETMAPHR